METKYAASSVDCVFWDKIELVLLRKSIYLKIVFY